MDFFAPVLPITPGVMRRGPHLALKYPSLGAWDVAHIATRIHEGITEISSPDRDFDEVAERRKIDPASFTDLPA